MRKKLLTNGIALLTSALLVSSFAGCTGLTPKIDVPGTEVPSDSEAVYVPVEVESETEESGKSSDENYADFYEPVILENLSVIKNGLDPDAEYKYLPTGLMERVMYSDKDELLEDIGYYLTDLTGDNIPELLIGENIAHDGDKSDVRSCIYGVYGIQNDQAVLLLEGWARNSQFWVVDGYFFNEGSNGAMSSLFGVQHFDENGELVYDDFYFSDDKNGEIAYFHNTTGVSDMNEAEEMNISGEEFWDIPKQYTFETIDWIPLDSYEQKAGGNGNVNTQSVNDEFSIIGSWYLRSYVNMTVIGYEIFDDGTWLAVENFGTLATGGSTHEENLSGTWFEEKSGEDYKEYSLYDENGSLMKNTKVYVDEDGNPAMDFGQNVIFYKSDDDNSDNDSLKVLADSWLFPNGAEISFDEEGGWMLSDDEGQWLFGGHYVMEPAPNTVYLRLHSPFGDTGNRWVADGTLEYDADGYPMLNLSFMPELTDFTGRNNILYKKQ